MSAAEKEEPSTPLDAANLLYRLETLPGISGAFFVDSASDHSAAPDSTDIVCVTVQKDIPANQARKFVTFGSLQPPPAPQPSEHPSASHGGLRVSFPMEVAGGSSIIVPSHSGKYLAIAQTLPAASSSSSSFQHAPQCKVRIQILERGGGCLVHDAFVPEKIHGSLYHDGLAGFETMEWSSDDKRILYCAEAPTQNDSADDGGDGDAEKPASRKPQFVRLGQGIEAVDTSSSVAAKASRPCSWTLKDDFEDDWGEQYVGRRRSALFVLDIASGAVARVKSVPEGVLPGNAVWTPDNKGVVFTGWDIVQKRIHTQRRLGLIYCMNRSTGIYMTPFSLDSQDGPCVKLTSQMDSAYCPRFNPSGTRLVFLSSEAAMHSGAHYACSSLHEISWKGIESDNLADLAVDVRLVVPKVDAYKLEATTAASTAPSSFPGLFGHIGKKAFVSDDRLLMTTQWRSEMAVVCINLAKTSTESESNITRLDIGGGSDGSKCACTVLSVRSNQALCSVSTPTSPAKLWLVQLKPESASTSSGQGEVESTTALDELSPASPLEIRTALANLGHSVVVCAVDDPQDPSQFFELTCVYSKGAREDGHDTPLPVILVPHGGPHSAFGCQFLSAYSFFALMGYCVVLVNYRGSTGFGQAALESLHGKVGSQDVADMLQALQHLPTSSPSSSPESGFCVDVTRVALYGGSHGGFLTTHLIGQAPGAFKAAAVRNPVTNLPLMYGTTDIPEWCVVEALGDIGKFSEILDEDDMRAMFDASPIKHVGQVTTPLLLLLGDEDRRVPVSQGLQFHRALQEQGSTSRVVAFEKDCHPIDKPQSAFQATLETLRWFQEHMRT